LRKFGAQQMMPESDLELPNFETPHAQTGAFPDTAEIETGTQLSSTNAHYIGLELA
jgi:hypothetical protein